MSTHEDFTRKEEIRGPSDRSFGYVFAAVFALAGLWPLLSGRPLRSWALAAGAIIGIVTLSYPALLHPANRLWMKLGLLLGKITNPIITALLFYLVFTPMGFLMRRFGKDPLRLAYDRDAASYWIERQPPGPRPDSMGQQF